MRFDTKAAARNHVWDRLQSEGAAAFPFPPHGRIPNFTDAKAAALRLMDHPVMQRARRIKVSPDAPQRPVRQAALEAGLEVIVPTPRLKGGFHRLDPRRIPPAEYRKAAGLAAMERFSERIAVADLPPVDLIVAGSVAVTPAGRRCGKGRGYSDLEYAILRELGHPPVPVATTVHDLQVVDDFPWHPHDLPLTLIATPTRIIDVDEPPAAPDGIDWPVLDDAGLTAMPVLAELKRSHGPTEESAHD